MSDMSLFHGFPITVLGEKFEQREPFSEDRWAMEAKITLTEGSFNDRLEETLTKIIAEEHSSRKRIQSIREGLQYLYLKGFVDDFEVTSGYSSVLISNRQIKVVYKCYDGQHYTLILNDG
jgi:hypothetical protein